jgi:ribosome-binding factor A
MLGGKRSSRVGDQILKVVADLLLKKVRDPRVKDVTLTGIEVSRDLRYSRIFFSVMGETKDIQKTQKGLDSARGFIKREIGSRLEIKYIPDIVFKYDPTLEKTEDLEKLFKQINLDNPEPSDNE